ncbi:YihA family ribosome biogenesis GTP-binding protein [Thermodesulfobacterium sp. TA1]|uniref:ribosome biogenesis GTP-binding protein YihA/YsxC n=1 Tax=Thermodesulfobacterium sp. TA1 TaxID=2234087 RepID=UPI001231F11E|nr:ribosome biogenesis GTP-binding protein YihA/YsxC [Thermodesulfobacterium sp. TA1]QER42594.1 YihA family ribosome biogenesis GTP-binding protein [Thermodesulfobacterium sp. TA1]
MFKNIEFIKSVFKLEDLPPPEFPEIAFLGRSNVGKSSLINAFLNRKKIARVSSTPGFTKALNFFRVDFRFYLVDLPGYGFAKVPPEVQKHWQRLIEGYLKAIRDFRCLILIFDIKRKPDEADIALIKFVNYLKKPYCVVLNKIDTLSPKEIELQTSLYQKTFKLSQETPFFLTSCKEKQGIDHLRKYLFACLGLKI